MSEAVGSYGESGARRTARMMMLRTIEPAIAPGWRRNRLQTMESMVS
jgi:hypothetical protein